MMIRHLALLPLLLAGCSMILDPETCSSASDCEGEGATCKDGICIAPAGGGGTADVVEADTLPVDEGIPEDTLEPDAAPDAAPDALPIDAAPDAAPDARPPVAPTCAFEAPEDGALTGGETIPLRVRVEDEDTPPSEIQVTVNGTDIALDEAGVHEADWPLDEGENTLVLRASDGGTGECAETITVTADRTAPIISLRSPRETLITQASDTIEVRIDIDEAHFAPMLYLNDALLEGVDFNDGTLAFMTLTLEEGDNAFSFVLEDAVGNRSEPLALTVIRDSTAPTIERLTPQEESTYADRVTVTGRVEDTVTPHEQIRLALTVNNSAGERVYGDASPIVINADGGEFSQEILLEEGDNDVTLCAFDLLGNGDCQDFSIERRSDAACATMEDVEPGSLWQRVLHVPQTTFTLTGAVCENVQAARVEIGDEVFEGTAGEGVFEVEVTVPDEPGSRQGTLIVNSDRDEAQVALSILYDPTPPALEITELRVDGEPLAEACTSSDRVSVCGAVSDDGSELEGQVLVNGEAGGVTNQGTFCVALLVDLPGDETAMQLTATASNRAGVTAEVEATLNVDHRAPTIEWIPEADGWVVATEGSVTLTATLDGGLCAASQVTVEGEAFDVVDGAVEVTLDLADGPQSITATLLDIAGNSEEVTHDFNVDGVAPEIALVSEAAPTTGEDTLEIVATVFEAGSGIAEARIDGEVVAPTPTAEEGRFEIRREVQVAGRAVGDPPTLTVTIEAEDLVGLSDSQEVTITYDSDAPQIELVTAEAFTTAEDAVEIVALVSDPGGAVTAARIGGEDVALTATAEPGRFEIRRQVQVAGAAAGDPPTLEVLIEADDEGGLTSERTVTITYDGEGPVVLVEAPLADEIVLVPFPARGTVSDALSDVASLSLNGVEIPFDADTGAFEVEATPNESHALIFTATDSLGNVTDPAVTVTVSVPLFVGHDPQDTGMLAASARWLNIEDLDTDGDLDVVAFGDGSQAYLRGPEGIQVIDPGLPAPPTAAALADVNEDGIGDWLVTGDAITQVWAGQAGGTYVALDNPEAYGDLQTGIGLAVGDLDANGRVDAIVIGAGSSATLMYEGDGFSNNPALDADLTACGVDVTPCTTLDNATAVALVDLIHADQGLEIIAVGPEGLSIWTPDGVGGYDVVHQDQVAATAMTFIDAPQDGALDLITLSAAGAQRYVIDGVTVAAPAPIAGAMGLRALVADLDGDARDDLVMFDDAGLRAWRQGDGGVLVAHDFEGLTDPAEAVSAALAADVDLDGDMDVLVATLGGVWLFESNQTFLSPDAGAVHARVRRGELVNQRADAADAWVLVEDTQAATSRALRPLPLAPTLISVGAAASVDLTARFPTGTQAQATVNEGEAALLSNPHPQP